MLYFLWECLASILHCQKLFEPALPLCISPQCRVYASVCKAEEEMISPKKITAQLISGIVSACIFLQQLMEIGKGSDQRSQPFPKWEERTWFESLARCFYFHKVNVSLSVLNMEGKLLLPLISDIAWAVITRIGQTFLLTTQLWMICQSPPFKITAQQCARMQELGTQPLMPLISSLASI